MQPIRDTVKSLSGDRFVVAYAPSNGIDTTDFYAGKLFLFRQYGPLIDLVGWVRHRVKGKGQWVVAVARLDADRKAIELIHSSYAPDRQSANANARDLRNQIQRGQFP